MTEQSTESDAPIVPLLSVAAAESIAQSAGLRPEMSRISFYRMLLHSPQIAKVEGEINDRILWEGQLTRRPEANRLRELAIMRLAWVTHSSYLWAHHFSPTVDKELPGVHPSDLLGVRDGVEHEGFGSAEKAVMAAVDEMVAHGEVSPETVEHLRGALGTNGELVELLYVIAIWRAITMLMATFRVPLEDHYSAWPPDGRGPTSSEPPNR